MNQQWIYENKLSCGASVLSVQSVLASAPPVAVGLLYLSNDLSTCRQDRWKKSFIFLSQFQGTSIPVCTCPEGYVGNGYGPNGCTQTSNICQTTNPCVHGQCVVSVSNLSFGVRVQNTDRQTQRHTVECMFADLYTDILFCCHHCSPPLPLLGTSASVTQAGKEWTVTRTSTSVRATPVWMVGLALMVWMDSHVPAQLSGLAHFARPHSKVWQHKGLMN